MRKCRSISFETLVLLLLLCITTHRTTQCLAFSNQLKPKRGNKLHIRLSGRRSNTQHNMSHRNNSKPGRKQALNNKQNSCLKSNNMKRDKSNQNWITSLMKSSSSSIFAAVLASTILVMPVTIECSTTTSWRCLSLVPSRAWSLTEQQILVNNVWTEVTRQYVDKSFNGLGEEGWRKKRLEAVTKVQSVGPDDTDLVYDTIRGMLSNLGDPYTRFLTPEQFETMTTYARGESPKAGIGVQLMGDPKTGRIVVLNTVPDSPAAKSGVLPGDVIVQVDEMDVSDGTATAEVVAAQCRGEMGTEVTLAVQHGGDGKPEDSISRISIKRSQIKSESVEPSIVSSKNGGKVGLIKISSFNLGTEQKVVEALNSFRGISAIVLDLRGNAGGYMPAGVNVAKLFLPPQASVISEINKGGRATVYTNDGVGSETKLPLYVLVDQRTASASEILTAALQDNRRATIIGTKTFGKGRIQNIQELQDGSGIAVTKAKYITPQGKDIHGVGISPDVKTDMCGSDVKPDECVKALI